MTGTDVPPTAPVFLAPNPDLVTIWAEFPELPMFTFLVAPADLSMYRARGWCVTHVRVPEDR